MRWAAILVAAAGCYALKVAGLTVPDQVLDRPYVRRAAALIPVALLSALVAVQVLGNGRALAVDARLAGLAVTVVALLLRAPFLVVVLAAAATAVAVRMV